MPALLDRFMPMADAGGRHETIVRAPADVVLDVARHLDMRSLPAVRAIFWLREKMLGARPSSGPGTLDSDSLLAMGWGILEERAGRCLVAGASCEPWQADVVFSPIPPESFASDARPGCVKIAWTLEAESIGPEQTRFATETRAVATDEVARRKFRRYWRLFGVGIVVIRLLLLPAIRREAERRWRAGRVCRPAPHPA